MIGREELPLDTLEDQGRALFGDTPGEPLTLVQPDENNERRLPERVIPYLMADGSGRAVMVPCHPDDRIFRLQQQSRECATRQLIERLRLARAEQPKRVLIGCNIPLPGIPVDELLSWDDLRPDRINAAINDAVMRQGGIRLCPQGLHEDAGSIFLTLEASMVYCKRNRPDFEEIARATLARLGSRLHLLEIRLDRPYARKQLALVFAEDWQTPESRVEAIWGPLK